MKVLELVIWLQLLIATTAATTASTSQETIQKINQVDQLFSIKGPTSEVLTEFERLIQEISNVAVAQPYLTQLYFKKALIEINLGKENQAIEDLKIVIKLDPLQKLARDKLIEILLARGDFDDVTPYVEGDADVLTSMNEWNNSMNLAKSHYSSSEYQSCLDALNEEALRITPKNYEVGELHYLSALELYKQDPSKSLSYVDEQGEESLPLNKVIILDLTKLINIKPWNNLNFYSILSQFILFTENQFENARSIISNCVRFDNEFKPCTEVSKFYSKFQDFLKILEQYSIITGHYYLEEKTTLENEVTNPNLDYKFIYNFLFVEELKVSRLEKRKLNSSIQTNYDYLIYRATKFLQELVGTDKDLSNLVFYQDLSKLACESHIQIKGSQGKVCQTLDNSFFPKYIPEIDKLLNQKKFQQAHKILEKFAPNVKQTKMFNDRFAKVQQWQQQQQHKQQQQQQQYFHNQQRQQQQRQQQPRKPLNDYYKVLGITKDADEREIKSAYRKMTLKYHPDKYKGNDLTPEEIEKKMQEINQAYEVLSNEELRARYDMGDDPNDNSGTSPKSGYNGGGFQFSGFNGFNGGFNGFPGGGGRRRGGNGGGEQFFQFFGGQGGRRGGGFKFA
ncbi:Chaperone protein DnaJ [Spathaspora sp. JA1]|nr:Chaperone protein DnaJ [Spathaspora sp. JA1]